MMTDALTLDDAADILDVLKRQARIRSLRKHRSFVAEVPPEDAEGLALAVIDALLHQPRLALALIEILHNAEKECRNVSQG
jgi:hypothetical protein